MTQTKTLLRNLWKNQAGQDFLEYALIAAFVATAAASLSPAIAATVAYMGRSMGVLQLALNASGN
ncbi:MAG: hypothetical protein RL328_912 [Acidobacteriota bacterium]